MTDSYVCSGATMRCTQGTSKARLTVLPTRTVFLTGQPMANISDHLTMVNLAPFGRCRSLGFPATAAATAAHHGHLTPMPCMHNTPFPWMRGKDDYIVKGDPALLKSSTCSCMWGGTISLVTDGQHETGSADLSHQQTEEFETDQPKKNGLDVDSVLDGIQLALDAAGFVPGFGAIPDLTNAAISALRGDWAGAGMSVLAAVPGIGDAAAAAKIAGKGVKAAKAASAAGKAGKAAKDAKAAGKVAEASKQAGKAGATAAVAAKGAEKTGAGAAKATKGGNVADMGKYREAKEARKSETQAHWRNKDKGGIEVKEGGGKGTAPVRKEATNDAPSYRDYSPKQAQQPSAVKAGRNSTYSQGGNTIRNSAGDYDPSRVNRATGASNTGTSSYNPQRGSTSGQNSRRPSGQQQQKIPNSVFRPDDDAVITKRQKQELDKSNVFDFAKAQKAKEKGKQP